MVPNEFVYEDDFIIDRGREGVGLGKKVVFRVIFNRSDESSLWPRR